MLFFCLFLGQRHDGRHARHQVRVGRQQCLKMHHAVLLNHRTYGRNLCLMCLVRIGYRNLIVTDAMDMGAITKQYTLEEAVVGCLVAGVDIVLSPHDFVRAFDAIEAAVKSGKLTEERINQSVRRILLLKITPRR